jgi:alanyl-tRNA synthetase
MALAHQEDLESLAQALNSPMGELQRKVEAMLTHQKQLEKQLRAVREQQAAGMASALIDQAISLPPAGDLPACPMILADLGNIEGSEIQTTADALKASFDGVIVLVAQSGESVVLLAVSGAAWQKTYPAGKIIQTLAPLVGGKGGGKPAFARGGGKSPEHIKDLLGQAPALVAGLAG